MTSLLMFGILMLLFALLCAWSAGKEKKFSFMVAGFICAGVSVVLLGAWGASLGIISSEVVFNQTGTYVLVGDTVSTLKGSKTHITTLYVPGDREYVYRFENLPPKGYKSVKTDDGKTLFVPEK